MIFGLIKKLRKKSLFIFSAYTLIIFFVLIIVNIAPALALSESTNFRLRGGQINSVAGSGSSASFKLETGGQSIAGKVLGSSFIVKQGSAFSGRTTATGGGGAGGGFPPGGGGGGGGLPAVQPEIASITITDITSNQARVIFTTNKDTVNYIEYGTDGIRDLITDTELTFATSHEFLLFNLIPNKPYSLVIHLRDTEANTAESIVYNFNTLAIFKSVPNASSFVASPGTTSINLSWINPSISDFAGVKLVRSSVTYPLDLSGGTLLFDGTAEAYIDSAVVANQTYYYTLFAYDTSFNHSSGAIASATITPTVTPPPPTPTSTPTTTPTPTPPPPTPTPEPGEEPPPGPPPSEPVVPAQPPETPAGSTPTPETGIDTGSSVGGGGLSRWQLVDFITLVRQNVYIGFEKITNIFAGLSAEGRSKVNTIKNGLVNENGDFNQDIYELLTVAERNQIEIIVEDSLPPVLEPESVAKIVPFNLKNENLGVNWHILANSDAILTIPTSVFIKPVKTITASIRTDSYILENNAQIGKYETIIKAPKEKGNYQVIIQIIYDDNTYEKISGLVLVDSYGYVYFTEQKEWSWSKPWEVFQGKQVLVSGAKVVLYTLNPSNQWVIWPSDLYKQYNPQSSSKSAGEYIFIAPPGRYYLTAEARGFKKYQSSEFTISKQIINFSIPLIPSLREVIKVDKPVAEKIVETTRVLGLLGGEQLSKLKKLSDEPQVEEVTKKIVVPAIVGASFVIVGPSFLGILFPLLRYLFLQPLLLLGLRKRKNWGTVYNSLNKLPLGLVMVRLVDLQTNKVVQSKVTDPEGHYGFFVVKPGTYKIEVIKNDFIFPSRLLSGAKTDGQMLDIYHGEPLVVDDKNVNVFPNIPIDQPDIVKTPARIVYERKVRVLQHIFAMTGILTTGASLLVTNVWYIWVFLAFHVLVYISFLKFIMPKKTKGWGIVYDTNSNSPIKRAVVRLFSKEYNKLIDFNVTDDKGRYALLVGPSDYVVTFEKEGYDKKKMENLNLTKSHEPKILIKKDIGMIKAEQNTNSSEQISNNSD